MGAINKMSYTQEALDEMAGENNMKQLPRLFFPEIQFNGTEGTLFLKEYNKETKEDKFIEMKEIKAVILKVRVSYNAFIKDINNKLLYVLTTDERDSQESMFNLYEIRNKQRDKIGAGTGKELKANTPLKMSQVLYLLLPKNKIVKLEVKGSGLANLFKFYKEFSKDERKREFTTIITSEAQSFVNEAKEEVNYFSLNFTKDKKLEAKAITGVIKQITELSEKLKATEVEAKAPIIKKEYAPVIGEDIKQPIENENEDEEIDVADIPF